jgi:hypothetical protein
MDRLSSMDMLSIASYIIGLQNLDMNISQTDFQGATKLLDKEMRDGIKDIHDHLAIQDKKIDLILKELEELKRHE